MNKYLMTVNISNTNQSFDACNYYIVLAHHIEEAKAFCIKNLQQIYPDFQYQFHEIREVSDVFDQLNEEYGYFITGHQPDFLKIDTQFYYDLHAQYEADMSLE